MRRMILFLAGVAALGAALALGGGFAGALHPAGDSLAVFRGALSVAGLGAAAALWLLGARAGAALAALVPVLALATLAPHRVASPRAEAGGGGVVLYQKNLSFRLADPGPLAAEIAGSGAEIVTLQEVHPRNAGLLALLAETYPTQVVCPFQGVGGVAVLSRWPAVPDTARCIEGRGLVSVTLRTPSGPVTAASVHLHWPWPHGQAGQVARLLPELDALGGPVVIGGDFNMVRWSDTLARIGAAAGVAPVGRARVTFPFGPGRVTGLAIDHVLATGGRGEVTARPALGSDHLGLLARVSLSPRP